MCVTPFKFPRYLARSLGINRIIVMLDVFFNAPYEKNEALDTDRDMNMDRDTDTDMDTDTDHVAILHVYSMLHFHASCLCSVSMYPSCMSMLLVTLFVLAACPCAWPSCMSMHVAKT
jgi:hypothetical protein